MSPQARRYINLRPWIEEAVTANADSEAAATWARRNGKASIAAKVRGEGAPGGISHELDGKGLDDLCQVYGDVESATFTATPTGIHRKIVVREIKAPPPGGAWRRNGPGRKETSKTAR